MHSLRTVQSIWKNPYALFCPFLKSWCLFYSEGMIVGCGNSAQTAQRGVRLEVINIQKI